MAAGGIFQALQKIATIVERLDSLTQDLKELRSSIAARVDRVESLVGDVRERLARLEASRDSDWARVHAEFTRFKAEVERAELRLTRRLPPTGKKHGSKS